MLEDLCMCCSKRSWGWRKKCLSDLLTDAVNEVEQEQRSELGDGAKPGRSPAHGGAARPLGRRPGGVLRRSCSRARKPGAGGGGDGCLERPGKATEPRKMDGSSRSEGGRGC